MMTYKMVCKVENNQILFTLPPCFRNRKEVTITIDDKVETKAQKLSAMCDAATDDLFLDDVSEVKRDFENIDHENL